MKKRHAIPVVRKKEIRRSELAGRPEYGMIAGALWLLSPYGYHPGEYRTDIGEQRAIELDDRSRIT